MPRIFEKIAIQKTVLAIRSYFSRVIISRLWHIDIYFVISNHWMFFILLSTYFICLMIFCGSKILCLHGFWSIYDASFSCFPYTYCHPFHNWVIYMLLLASSQGRRSASFFLVLTVLSRRLWGLFSKWHF